MQKMHRWQGKRYINLQRIIEFLYSSFIKMINVINYILKNLTNIKPTDSIDFIVPGGYLKKEANKTQSRKSEFCKLGFTKDQCLAKRNRVPSYRMPGTTGCPAPAIS
jgi:hypothetical protein